jgi:tRNA threonylcarbamoyladenosine biosynthesis protein TsaE
LKFLTQNAIETEKFGRVVGQLVQPGSLILLNGDLGAGKTTFTKGLAQSLGIERAIKSPTFTLIREYRQGRLPLFHMDLYRLEHSSADDLGLEEYFDSAGVCVVEWSQFGEDVLPADRLVIDIQRDLPGFAADTRQFTLRAAGSKSQQLLEKITTAWSDQ